MKIRAEHILLAVVTLIIIGCMGVWYVRDHDLTDFSLIDLFVQDDIRTYQLGVATRVGCVGVELHYDVEPVKISLIGPDGTEYSESNHQSDIMKDPENKTIIFCLDTNQTGEWFLRFNRGRNNHITYKMINRASSTLHLQDISMYEENGITYLQFTPVMGEPTNTDPVIHMTISLNNMYKSYILLSEPRCVNTISKIAIDIPVSAYEYEDYTMILSVSYTDDKGNQQSDHHKIAIHLNQDHNLETTTYTEVN